MEARDRYARWLLAGALAVWVAAAIVALVVAMPLKHDEAAYVIGARRMLAGGAPYWLYRSLGTELLAAPAVLAGATADTAFRVVPALVTLLVPIGAYRLARALRAEQLAAAVVAAVFAGNHVMLLQDGLLLGDLPATGTLLCALAIATRELSREGGPGLSIAWAAPWFAATFYLRYGSTPALIATAGATVLCYARVIVRRPLPVLALAGAFALLVVPHFAFSLHETGSLLGVLDESTHSTRLLYTGEGLVTYATVNPFVFYGAVVAPVLIAGVVVAIATRDRARRFVGLVALGTFVLLGIKSHAQPRYAFAFVALFVVLGVVGVWPLVAKRRWGVRAGVAVAIAGMASGLAWTCVFTIRERDRRDAVVDLARAIRRDAAGRPCAFIAIRQPQLAYYSGCGAYGWPDVPGDLRTYVVSMPGSVADMPQGRVAHPLAGADGVWLLDP